MKMPLFSFEQVSVAHRGGVLLRNISLSLNRGESLGIVGPNGAGKSSFLLALMGFRKIVSGKAEFLSIDIRSLKSLEWPKVRKKVGYLPQQLQIDPLFPITAEEIVLLGRVGHAGFLHRLADEDRSIADGWIQTFGLNDLRRRPFGQLSGGEQQKINLARLMAQCPEILLLDEPTAGLDLEWQRTLGELIERIARERTTGIVMVTHEVHQLPPSCRKVMLLRQGEMFRAGEKDKVLAEDLLSQVYGCQVKLSSYGGRTYLLPWSDHD